MIPPSCCNEGLEAPVIWVSGREALAWCPSCRCGFLRRVDEVEPVAVLTYDEEAGEYRIYEREGVLGSHREVVVRLLSSLPAPPTVERRKPHLSLRSLWIGVFLFVACCFCPVYQVEGPALRAWQAHARVKQGMTVRQVVDSVRGWDRVSGLTSNAYWFDTYWGDGIRLAQQDDEDPVLVATLTELVSIVQADSATYGAISWIEFSYARLPGRADHAFTVNLDEDGRVMDATDVETRSW